MHVIASIQYSCDVPNMRSLYYFSTSIKVELLIVMNMKANVVGCIPVDTYRPFRATCCLYHKVSDVHGSAETSVLIFHNTVCHIPEDSLQSSAFCDQLLEEQFLQLF